jgi:hypothetical protein
MPALREAETRAAKMAALRKPNSRAAALKAGTRCRQDAGAARGGDRSRQDGGATKGRFKGNPAEDCGGTKSEDKMPAGCRRYEGGEAETRAARMAEVRRAAALKAGARCRQDGGATKGKFKGSRE